MHNTIMFVDDNQRIDLSTKAISNQSSVPHALLFPRCVNEELMAQR